MYQSYRGDEMCTSSLILYGCVADFVREYCFTFNMLKTNIKTIYEKYQHMS